MVGIVIVLLALGVLGVHWLDKKSVLIGILILLVDVFILGVFVAAAFRKKG